jgi:hypothetical protein
MSAVDVEVRVESEDAPGANGAGPGPRNTANASNASNASNANGGAGAPDEAEEAPRGKRKKPDSIEIEIEREVTKRQLIQSISSIVVVVLYMVFTLLRDRESGVVVVDPDDGGDDWDE